MMQRICGLFLLIAGISSAEPSLRESLERTYNGWRAAIIAKDPIRWSQLTAEHRRIVVKNRILSEKKRFPSAVFDLPAEPPSLKGLKFLDAQRNGPTAKGYYFGKVDFGMDMLSENLLVISFVGSDQRWNYDSADFVNLAALPEVRQSLAAGDLSYIKSVPELQPNGKIPMVPLEIKEPPYIAKVYVFCPGRKVDVTVNRMSHHHFGDSKEAELVIGGAYNGENLIQFRTQSLEGSTGKEALAIRVYLMSQISGVMPVKAFEYLVREGETVKASEDSTFVVNQKTIDFLMGRSK